MYHCHHIDGVKPLGHPWDPYNEYLRSYSGEQKQVQSSNQFHQEFEDKSEIPPGSRPGWLTSWGQVANPFTLPVWSLSLIPIPAQVRVKTRCVAFD